MGNCLLGMELRGRGVKREKREGILRLFCGDVEGNEMKREDFCILLYIGLHKNSFGIRDLT